VFLKGSVFESQSSLGSPANSFIVKDSGGTTVFFINSSGDAVMTGSIKESSGLAGTGSMLEFHNSSGSRVGLVDSSGNLKIQGGVYENYLN